MKCYRYKIIIKLLLLNSLLGSWQAIASKWEKVLEEDGVTSWKKSDPNSTIMSFKGEKLIDAPIAKLVATLTTADEMRKKRWVALLSVSKRLHNDNKTIRTYSVFDLPFPIANRDFVFEATKIIDVTNRTVSLIGHSIDDPQFPKTEHAVRINLRQGSYVLKSVGNGDKTLVTVEVNLDPGGMILPWLANKINQHWPHKTLIGMEKEAQRPDAETDDEIARIFAEK